MSKPENKNIFKVLVGAKKPTILMSGFIGEYSKINTNDFQDAVAKFEADNETDVDILINSGGGSTITGLTIGDIMNLSSINFHGIVTGMAASMAGSILMFCDSRSAYKNARIMTHKVTGGGYGESDHLRSMADLIDQEEEKIINQFIVATGQTEKTVNSWFKAGIDKWFNSKDALKNGMISKIIEPPKPIKIDNSLTEPHEIFNAYESATQDLYPSVPSNKNTDTTIMKKTEIIAMLTTAGFADNLTSNSTDEQLSEVLQNVVNKAVEADNAQAQLDAFLTKNGEAIIGDALKAGKIPANEKEEWLKDYKENPRAITKAISRMSGKPNPNANLDKPIPEGELPHPLMKGRKDWTFDKWQEEAPEDLGTISDEAPEVFDTIFKTQYK